MKYRFRSSQLSTLLDGCGKVRNKLEWKDLDKISDAHIKLAIEVFNASRGFTPYSWNSLDMHAGVEHEPEAVRMLDKLRNTNYYEEYKRVRDAKKPFDKSNEYTTGTRDVGGDFETLDTKVSTDKNVFDLKRFKEMEIKYVVQQNNYGVLYGTKDLYLANVLMPATYGQIHKMVSSEGYISMMTDEMKDMLQDKLENTYNYDHLSLDQRIQVVEVPKIDNFEEIISHRVKIMNKWIEKNLETKYNTF